MLTVKRTSQLISLIAILATAACTSIPTRVHDSGIKIEPVSNDTGSIRSAGFWRDRNGISLRGEVSPNPVSESPLAGHIDVSITVPDKSSTVCTTADPNKDPKHVLKSFSRRFESLPPRGSLVRVWHHPAAATHDSCVN